MDISKILESANVERFHAVPKLTGQTIAQHSWGVSMLVQYFNPECRKELVLAALTHDCAELVTGDVPATTKWDNPELKMTLAMVEDRVERQWGIKFDLDSEEQRLLKLCDAMEGMNYCVERAEMGEIAASTIFWRWSQHVQDNFKLDPKQQKFYGELIYKMEILDGR